MSKAIYTGVYDRMNFPEYRFVEYPKWVQKKDGTSVIVNSQVEELRMIDEVAPIKDIVKVEEEKKNLQKLLDEANAKLAELNVKDSAPKEPVKPVK